jgi:suppressor of ftsI
MNVKSLIFVMFTVFVIGCSQADITREDNMMPQMGHNGPMMVQNKGSFNPGEDFPTELLQDVKSSTIVNLKDGDTLELSADIIVKEINGKKYKMYGYNGQIPGPVLKLKQDSTIKVNFENNIDLNTTIHWHGLRHDNKDDGVPGVTQDPIQPGESFSYEVYFPDEGIYWYHPHIREDIQQDNGLAGNMLVTPIDENYFNKVNREEMLILDDILIEDGEIIPYGKDHANFAIMGRYGNVMLLNGEPFYELNVNKGEVVRFYVTNVANARPFNLSFGGAKIKLIGSDLGKYEREKYVDSIIISPAERYIVEVYFENEKGYVIQNVNHHKTYDLGQVSVRSKQTDVDYSSKFDFLKQNDEIINDIDDFREFFDEKVDYELELTIDMPMMERKGMMMAEHEDIEWEDEMGIMNAQSDTSRIRWVIRDKESGKENMNFKISAKQGDKLKIRLFNDPESMHPMQHPFHIHGQRFLVLSVDGQQVENLVWKDTVLVPIGKTVDILVDVTNPGEWMMHCHIAEHLEAGMMSSLSVV